MTPATVISERHNFYGLPRGSSRDRLDSCYGMSWPIVGAIRGAFAAAKYPPIRRRGCIRCAGVGAAEAGARGRVSAGPIAARYCICLKVLPLLGRQLLWLFIGCARSWTDDIRSAGGADGADECSMESWARAVDFAHAGLTAVSAPRHNSVARFIESDATGIFDAALADEYLAINAGTDTLALGMMRDSP